MLSIMQRICLHTEINERRGISHMMRKEEGFLLHRMTILLNQKISLKYGFFSKLSDPLKEQKIIKLMKTRKSSKEYVKKNW